MKKIIIMLISCLIFIGLTGCGNVYKGKGTELLNDYENKFFSIKKINNDKCESVVLILYDNNKYELYTEYADCRPWQNCTTELIYNKSIKGNYDYEIKKILEESININNNTNSNDDLPEYEIYIGTKYIEEYKSSYYTIKEGDTNKYLEELLEQLDINLETCLIPNYHN